MRYLLQNSLCFFFFCLLLLSCGQKQTLFESLSSSKTGIVFQNNLPERDRFGILYYLYFYNGGGVSVGDINNDGLPDIYFTANSKGGNKLYLNKGAFAFEDITANAGVAGLSDWCSGVTMADVNGDGWLDIYVSTVSNRYGLNGRNELYINNKNNSFTESAKAYGLNTSCFTSQSAFFDYDHDGDLDCYILNQSHHPHANIVDTAARRGYDSLSGDRLYRNDMNGPAHRFTDVSAAAGIYQSNLGYGLGLAVSDLNNDGWDDIYIGNDFHENDYCYINNGNGTFKEDGAARFNHYSRFSMGNDIADYNNDGQPDVVTVDMLPPDEKILKTYGSDENADVYKAKLQYNGYQTQYSKNCLQRNNGSGISFSETALQSGVAATDWSWCPLLADFDNDGAKDLLISSGIVKRPVDLDYIRFASDLKARGMDKTDKLDKTAIDAMPDGASHPFLFKGDGKSGFTDQSESWGTASMKGYYNGAAYADLDNDGALDLVISAINAPAVILKNSAPKKQHLSLSFKGSGGNTFGVGVKAYIFQKGVLQYQELMLTRGFQSSSDTRLHFGLDSLATVDSLLIVWPDQCFQVLKNVSADKELVLRQDNATGYFDYNLFFPAQQPLLMAEEKSVPWQHNENNFLDYNVQYLIPHAESARGPKLAVGDVNGDGLDDLYACGAAGQAGALLIQKSDGSFAQQDTALFAKDAACEDVDAVFFDANGDKKADLYVASGGNEYADGAPQLLDRLYINDGAGHYTKSNDGLGNITKNKSCVAVADVDRDGDEDLFVGTLTNAKAYGLPQTSYLLINNGKGSFSIASEVTAPLANIGTVTTALFADLNNDGWPDLAVTGEWMPLKIYTNNKGRFVERDAAHSTGLWQTLYATDVNGDGYTDLLAGNWGHNTKLWAGKDGPCKLFVKDFDNNGSIDQLLCYSEGKKDYTFLVKDELERALPVLKKHYLTYTEVAGKTVDYVFFDLFKDYTELDAEVLASSCFTADGKGGFTRTDLPDDLQMAPVMSFTSFVTNNHPIFLAAGNFYGVIPYEGRYDALQPTLFSTTVKNKWQIDALLPAIKGEVRDAKWLRTTGGERLLVLARNNDGLQFFRAKP